MQRFAIGVVGLGVMGKNLALNLADHGCQVVAHDPWPEPMQRFGQEASAAGVQLAPDLATLVRLLPRPRTVLLLLKAGQVVDSAIGALRELLEPSDLIIDAGNEHFTRTEARTAELAQRGLHFMGLGVSGGEKGARLGPALMPGGQLADYERLAPMLESIAARGDAGPCVAFIGPGGAGHYVKMIHNGIEYADMQLIAEAYAVLRQIAGCSVAECADVFQSFAEGELASFLLDITVPILRHTEPDSTEPLIERVRDSASMKGTGSWTVQEALALGVPVGTIAAAVEARQISARHAERQRGAELLAGPRPQLTVARREQLIEWLRAGLYSARVVAYAQGFALARAAREHGYAIDRAELARIWTGGCIIRARLLADVRRVFQAEPDLAELSFAEPFASALGNREAGLRQLVITAQTQGVAVPAFASALAYYDAYRSARLPANLTEAQRDYFGSHGYERLDRPGRHHTIWD